MRDRVDEIGHACVARLNARVKNAGRGGARTLKTYQNCACSECPSPRSSRAFRWVRGVIHGGGRRYLEGWEAVATFGSTLQSCTSVNVCLTRASRQHDAIHDPSIHLATYLKGTDTSSHDRNRLSFQSPQGCLYHRPTYLGWPLSHGCIAFWPQLCAAI
jgi:hypothetical protein